MTFSTPLRLTQHKNSGCCLEAPQRQNELSGHFAILLEAMVSVKTLGDRVLGVDHQRVDGYFRTRAAQNGVGQQRSTELAALKRLIDRQSAKPCNRHRGVTGKPFCQGRRQVKQGNTGCRKGVIASDIASAAHRGCCGTNGTINGDKTCTRAPPHVLGNLVLEVAVQSGNATGEAASSVTRAQHLDAESRCHFGLTRRLCACRARFIAGETGGGFSKASANRCWSSTDKRMICVCSIVRCASSSAAATMKSLRLRPWISAARRTTASASGAMRASMRDVRGVSVLDNMAGLFFCECTSFFRTLSSMSPWSLDRGIELTKTKS